MVTLLAAARSARRIDRRLARAVSVTGRNVAAARHASYWLALLSGFFEPLLYLLSIGVGVGAMIDGFTLPDGRTVGYAEFVAPAMLAASAMNGAFAESTFNFFGKMKFQKLYDAVLATPVAPVEIAVGELLTAMLRGAVYAAAFLGIMVATGLTSVGWALVAFPATMLVGFAFGACGMALATYMRGWQDFDYVVVGMFALFMFSGTFAPADSYPAPVRVLVEVTPLYHGVELLRGITTGAPQWSMLWHLAYLLALTAVGLAVAGKRVGTLLCR